MSGNPPATRDRVPVQSLLALSIWAIAALDGWGWVAGSQVLTSIVPGRPSMSPVTASLLALVALGLWMLEPRRDTRGRRRMAYFCGWAVAILAGGVLLGLWLRPEFDINRWLFRGLSPDGRAHPTPMLCLICLGLCLGLFDWEWRRGQHPGAWLVFPATLIALTALIGHVYAFLPDGATTAYLPMSLNATVCLLLAAAALTICRPERGLGALFVSQYAGGTTVRRLLPAAVLVPVAVGWVVMAGEGTGWYQNGFALSLFTVCIIVVFSLLIWWNARQLDHTDEERRQAMVAVTNAENRASLLLDSAGQGMFGMDVRGQCTFMNRAGAELLRRSIPSILGQDLYSLLRARDATGDSHPREQMAMFRALTEGEERRTDVESFSRGDGAVFPVEYLASPVRDAAGDLRGVVVSFTDVTQRKRAEVAFDQERSLLLALMDHLPDAIYFKNKESQFIRISKALARKFGLADPALAQGKTDRDFFTAEHAQQAWEDEEVLLKGQAPIVLKEEKETWADGHATWVATTKLSLRDLQGRVVGTFGVSRDITGRKMAEEALRESEARQRAIVEAALDCIITIDHEGRISDFNPAAESTFQYKRDEVIGRPVDELLFPPETGDRQRDNLQRYSLKREQGSMLGRRLEFPALRKNGEQFVAEMAMQPISRAGVLLFTVFLRDITERKKAEEALRLAKEAAESANRAKSDFLANMSHEIRTPLNAIIGMTELLIDTSLSTAQLEYLSMVRDSGESLLTVINDILDFSKIEAGRLELERVPFDLRETLGDTMKSLALRAHRKQLELACHVAPNVPMQVMGDPGRLRQIVVNLVGNAIKFTDRGEIVLDVGFERFIDQKLILHISVRDTGVGIPLEKQAKIFEAFEQADTSTTRRFGGTGLGLTISSRLVELMHGRLWVESVLGHGSTFHFTVELDRCPDGHSLPNADVHVRGLRVLIVDDNATNRLILDEMLRNWEMRPVLAASAAEGIAAIQQANAAQDAFGLILTDANMPEEDGFSFAEQLKRDRQLQGAMIMMLTSGDRPGDMARCESLGFAAYLIKPIKQSELFDSIMHALASKPRPARPGLAARGEDLPIVRPLRLLLAEDSIVNQRLAVGLLQKWGHSVTVANNGREAVERVIAEQFDAVLMDVQMPEMDGLQATAAIRERERTTGGHIPIIAMTAHAMKGDREHCLVAGMDAYVSKPVRPKDLADALAQVAAASRSAADASGSDVLHESAASPTASLIDWHTALQTVQGDRNLLDIIIDAFLQEAPQLLQQLARALERKDGPLVQRAAHTLKGAVRSFGPTRVSELAAQLERSGREATLEGTAEPFGELTRELYRVMQELRTYHNSDSVLDS